MLTLKQYELLKFIHERVKESGIAPSFTEMMEALDLMSKSGIHRLLAGLEERGFIRRLPNRARAVEVMKLPEAIDVDRRKGFKPRIVRNDLAIDAARYRHLRSRGLKPVGSDGVVVCWRPGHIVLNLEELDRAVDEAIAKEKRA